MSKDNKKDSANQMWGGHFEMGPAEILEKINASIDFDKKLYSQDIRGSVAHCEMLAKQDIITKEESTQILSGLQQVREEIEAGNFKFSAELEDIHMNVEARLKEIIGDVAGKLHTGRSRNDQVATDFKLYVRDAIDGTIDNLEDLLNVIEEKAAENKETIMPGFTHLQTAQPVTFCHHLMAYYYMFERDLERFEDARDRLNKCPLGAAALAGTSFPLDREYTAEKLGFNGPTENSLDSVSDRDFALEFLNCLNMTALHLSRLSEELVIWCSHGFKFVKLSDSFTTGSSIMPQKRNPDAAELVRAKVGRILGAYTNLSVVMKGLPLAYSKDMQEDKEPVFDAYENATLCIKAMTGMLSDIETNKENMLEASKLGYSTATDIADWLVKNLGMPFRNAHHVTGRCVKIAEEKQCRLDELSLEELQSVEPEITEDIYNVLSVESSVNSRTSFGGASPKNYEDL